jgi:putative transposase
MARLPRLYAPDVVQRIVQRAAGDRTLFEDADDYRFFLDLTRQAASDHGLAVHAYALLPKQIQVLATPASPHTVPRTMQAIGRRYVPYINRRTGRIGPLWERRYRSTLIEAELYLLDCMRHLECQPVVHGYAQTPDEWRWSSYRHHVGLEQDTALVDHPLYWALRNTPFERQAAYRSLAETALDVELSRAIERATDSGWALGSETFLRAMAGQATRRITPLKRGRPRKTPIDTA